MTNIRLATAGDCEAIATVHLVAWRESFADILSEVAFGTTIQARVEGWRKILDLQPPTSVYVADREGQIIGFAAGGPGRGEDALGQAMQIHAIYLLDRAKRQGIGGALLRTVIGGFLEQGHGSACVWTLRDARPARGFYENFGAQFAIEKLERRPGYQQMVVGYIWPDLGRAFFNQDTANPEGA